MSVVVANRLRAQICPKNNLDPKLIFHKKAFYHLYLDGYQTPYFQKKVELRVEVARPLL